MHANRFERRDNNLADEELEADGMLHHVAEVVERNHPCTRSTTSPH